MDWEYADDPEPQEEYRTDRGVQVSSKRRR